MKGILYAGMVIVAGFCVGIVVWLWSGRAPPAAAPVFHAPYPNPHLSLLVEPHDGIGQVLSLINHATTSVDLVMYELTDTTIEKALVAAAHRGVSVRVLLNKGYYGDPEAKVPLNQQAYTYLSANGVLTQWTPASFALTHEKLLIADSGALIMGFNLTPAYYATSRDFAVSDTDARDIRALESVFDADWSATSSDTVQAIANEGADLVWSPGSESALLSLIASAQHAIVMN
ncbi:MAG: phospholipase D-like domain-containing protein [Candidatus Pacebacteria bacterium]|nr:phospholipase D-like domain-containing protein [Candidatus Paceibacterota bacterium]